MFSRWQGSSITVATLVILGMYLLARIRLKPSTRTKRIVIGLVLAFVAISLTVTAVVATHNLSWSLRSSVSEQWQVAQALDGAGVHPGDSVSTMTNDVVGNYWAYLARVKIVEKEPFEEMSELSSLDRDARIGLIKRAEQSGAKALVVGPSPPSNTGLDLRRLGRTNYFILSLR